MHAKFIVAMFLLALSLNCHAQEDVYAIGDYHGDHMTVIRVDEHAWIYGPMSNRYGIIQFRSRTSASTRWVTCTKFYIGPRHFTVKMPLVLLVSIGIAGIGSLVLGGNILTKGRWKLSYK